MIEFKAKELGHAIADKDRDFVTISFFNDKNEKCLITMPFRLATGLSTDLSNRLVRAIEAEPNPAGSVTMKKVSARKIRKVSIAFDEGSDDTLLLLDPGLATEIAYALPPAALARIGLQELEERKKRDAAAKSARRN